jgi:hypothetical protein
MSDITIVTGLWDIGRKNLDNTSENYNWKRSIEFYIEKLEELLSTNLKFVVYGDSDIENVVKKYTNCIFIYYSKENLCNNIPYFNKIDKIRTSKEWYDQPTAQWLKSSPQAQLPLYVPIQLNKLFLIQKSVSMNPFNTTRFYWADAGITRTHDIKLLRNMSDSLLKYNKFMFLSHYYVDNTEIHGFLREGIYKYCNKSFIDRIMKGFFFGGKVDNLNEIIDLYNDIIKKSLDEKYLGVDETYFTIMVNQKPELFNQIMITDCHNTMLEF